MQGRIHTDKSVSELIKSPAFARWARENHDRIQITPRGKARRSIFDDEDVLTSDDDDVVSD